MDDAGLPLSPGSARLLEIGLEQARNRQFGANPLLDRSVGAMIRRAEVLRPRAEVEAELADLRCRLDHVRRGLRDMREEGEEQLHRMDATDRVVKAVLACILASFGFAGAGLAAYRIIWG